ncbi:hypothetical protein ABOM_011714 [Aspergillus bombycis]|uniref:Uncharacterized protein n=1 Tax=Aspergillus bombycis TaxID=109264 RepID=A0A1F7ZLP2_9EURO|nr:hypothetical protein ABOM_011714 [Aspergillus bombycis]OGM40331.1 hypothetical protein ABOM_011714 [Aspergillus bombycis]
MRPLAPREPTFFCAPLDAHNRVIDPPDPAGLIDYFSHGHAVYISPEEKMRKETLFMEGVMVDANNTNLVCVFVDVPNAYQTAELIRSSITELERRYQDVAEDHIGLPQSPNDLEYYTHPTIWNCGIYPGHPQAALGPGFTRICFTFATTARHSGEVLQGLYYMLRELYMHVLKMEHNETPSEMGTQVSGSQSPEPTARERAWRVRSRAPPNKPTDFGREISEFRRELREHEAYSHMALKLDRPGILCLFEQWVVVDLVTRERISLFFHIPWSDTGNVNALYAIKESRKEADKIPRNNSSHMVHPSHEVPGGKQRICFEFETSSETQAEVLDCDLNRLFDGIEQDLEEMDEEGRTLTLPIKYNGSYVFQEGKIDKINEWNRSPSNIKAKSL